MIEPNSSTEIIIQKIKERRDEVMPSTIASDAEIDVSIVLQNLELLETYDIAKVASEPYGKIVRKLSKFNDVILSGGIIPYLEKQNQKTEQEARFKKLQLEEQEIKNRYIERQYKMQHRYFILALIISCLALVISFLSYMKK
jgi:hypothetical protein